MNRGLPSLIAGTLLVAILALYMVTYQVRFTETAVVKTFGKATPQDVIREPGLKWKAPWPIQQVDIYDNRVQLTATTGEETPTRDGKPVIVTTAIGWRISDPYLFNRTCGSIREAEDKLKTLVRNDQKTVISRYDFHNYVSIDPKELQYDKIEEAILAQVQPKAAQLYGIDIKSIGLEKLALPQRITETVFEAMKRERQAKVASYTSEGQSKADQIKATADGIAATILAFADLKAAETINEGLRRANKYNSVFGKDPALAAFLLKVENLPKLLKEKSTTIVLDQNSPLLDLLFAPSSQPAGAPAARPQAKAQGSAAPLIQELVNSK